MEETTKQLLTTIAENQPKIKELGYNEGFSAGKKAEHKEFMDMFITNRTSDASSLAYAFYCWNEAFFYPTMDIVSLAVGFNFAFYNMRGSAFSLKERLEECGVILDTSKATNVTRAFGWSPFTELPILDFSGVVSTSSDSTFISCTKLVTIEKLILAEGAGFSSWFNRCDVLKNIVIEGVIGRSISFSNSPLSVESLKSIITHLKDYSGTESEFAYTVTFLTSAFEALEAEGSTSPNGNTWTEYIDDLKWNLTLA